MKGLKTSSSSFNPEVLVLKYPFRQKVFQTPYGKLEVTQAKMKHAEGLRRVVSEPEVNKFVLVELPVTLSSTRKRIKEAGCRWFVAVLGGKVVGSVDLSPSSGKAKHVANFGISFSKKVHGKGIASLVLKAVLDYAKKNGIELISSRVFIDNSRGRAFYRKMGFKEVGVLKKHLKRNGKYLNDVLIVKQL